MASGIQAAQLFLSKVGEPTGIDTCVKSMVSEIFAPLGVPVPNIVWVHEIMQPPFTKVATPAIGDVAIFPGLGHASMITGISGNSLQETSFGTSSGFVRSAWYDIGFYDSFFRPPYDSTQVSTASDTSVGTPVSDLLGVPHSVYTPQFWTRIGVGLLGGIILTIGILALLSDTAPIPAVLRIAKRATEIAK